MYLSVLHFLQFHFTVLVVINLLFWVYYGIIGIPPYTITLHPLVCSPHSRKLTYTLLTSTNHKSPILLWSVDIRHNKSIQKTGLNKYLVFCAKCKQQAIPVSEHTLVLFITHLASQQLSHATIQVYVPVSGPLPTHC